MKLIWSIIFLSFLSSAVYPQLAEPLNFNEKTHDFGEILEQNGNAEFDFVFTNNSGRPIKIISVQASCGCTTPGWTKEAVAPGKTGYIKASYNPKGRPGYFNKSLTVSTDLSGSPIILQIKGSVVDKLSNKNELLTAANGNLRLNANSFNVGKVFINKESSPAEFVVSNSGTQTIEFTNTIAPQYITVLTPHSLKPGERGIITIKYDAQLKKSYGFQSENIEIITTDKVVPNKSFSVYATVEEYFPVLSTEELMKAPIILVDKYEVDFQRLKPNTWVENTVSIQNKGKKNLELRHLQSNCSCLIASYDKRVLKPGETGKITLRLNTEGRSGTQNKAVTIYSNDPRNPVQRITVSGYVEE